MLELDGLHIRQGGFELSADLRVEAGEFTAIVGPSGAGKSTLLSVVAGFLQPVAGRVLWRGTDLSPLEPGQRPVSIVFQDHNLFPHLSCFDNIALGISPRLKLGDRDRMQIDAALDRVGLGGLGDRRPGSLSGGQQSRVSLARVLVRRRPLVLLDEPFSALGPALRAEMLDLVRDVAHETEATVLMVSHEPKDALRVAGTTIFVDRGVAHPPESTVALFDDPPPGLAAYIGAGPTPD